MCSFFKCIGCCCCCLFLIVLTLGVVITYFYAVYVPHVPLYEIEKLEVKAFDMHPDLTLDTQILVTVRAYNPNSNIGFVYGDNGTVSLVFNQTDVLCSGKPPNFMQGHNNVTMIKVDLAGKSKFGPGLQAAYDENQKSQKPVPLLVTVEMPMRVVIEHVPLREFRVFVNSSLMVDNLAPNKTIKIVSSDTVFHFEF
ncbi:hypothetical protein C2S53_016101 [Perilla frutescens var. hirtella]|uniref:Late embryogenesis abundant protein LEA-2 subgroup domain-containing protein n=1 Tax=Perilla frutescens var. hirtella TaxID=608512 RepID=A0AAD4J4Q0_PERFH|nr:hypothetical protein C2S53_016101 [Perilla frutescens var. hirtella]